MSLLRSWLNKPKYVVVFLRKYQKSMMVVKKREYSSINKLLKGKGKKFVIDINNPCYILDNKKYYFVDYENGSNYFFNEVKFAMKPDELDSIVSNNIIQKLIKGVIDNKKMKILYFVVGCVIGILAGLFIMQIIMQKKLEELWLEFKENNTEPIPFSVSIKSIGMMLKCLR